MSTLSLTEDRLENVRGRGLDYPGASKRGDLYGYVIVHPRTGNATAGPYADETFALNVRDTFSREFGVDRARLVW